ncbi:spermidine/putrescine transport system ATP-binding protein [Variovorax sp. PDC80]|uniref:ABC transporter ATP-binding protein n=1 Tax=Variovorax sp. PDC80 TaxID=1882827 RepID=UPI0008E912EF|nr:ABC transporter ATP-binding protein [Variovorax sp. PDC80]SFQ04586.1 spermidine/putrescine transport system ATP-binding protein [Variovorax sp. PDC80]
MNSSPVPESGRAPLVQLSGVSKSYGGVMAVSGVDLEIARGEFVAIMGPSGCGKTTTLRMLAGLENPSSGSIRLNGEEVRDLAPWQRDTPMVWQSLALFPFLSVIENVEFGLRMRKVGRAERRRRATDWLARLGLADFAQRRVDELSGGQRQRVALARSLVTEPPLLLLDEPLSALDHHLSLKMQGELTRLQRELGIAFVYVTHSHSEAFAMADRVVIMANGEVAQCGAPMEVFHRPASRFVAEFLGGNNIFQADVVARDGSRLELRTPEGRFTAEAGAQGGAALAAGAAIDLVVRADRISLTAKPGWATNEVACTLVGEEFIGSTVNGHLETSGGKQIVVQLNAKDLEEIELDVGRQFYASWHPEDCHLVQRPHAAH